MKTFSTPQSAGCPQHFYDFPGSYNNFPNSKIPIKMPAEQLFCFFAVIRPNTGWDVDQEFSSERKTGGVFTK